MLHPMDCTKLFQRSAFTQENHQSLERMTLSLWKVMTTCMTFGSFNDKIFLLHFTFLMRFHSVEFLLLTVWWCMFLVLSECTKLFENHAQVCPQAYCTKSTKHKISQMLAQEHIIGSAEALPILCVRYNWWERERESETEVVRRKWRHHCRAKIGDKFALSLAKNSHLSFPPSHFPPLPSRRGHQRRKWRHHCRAKIGDKFALSLAKNSHLSFPPSHFPSLPSLFLFPIVFGINYRKRGSASYIVREVQLVRERERVRRK